MMEKKVFDVIIGGKGVQGMANLYSIARFTNAQSILTIERHSGPAMVNSNVINNAQTLHSGESETNMPLKKALEVKEGYRLMKIFLSKFAPHAFERMPKLLLAIGEEEIAKIQKRYVEFRPYYPKIELFSREEIKKIEPAVVEGRDPNERIMAIYNPDGIAANYQLVAIALWNEAKKTGKDIRTMFSTEIKKIRREKDYDVVETDKGEFYGKTVIMSTGPYSLLFAQAMGIPETEDLAILPVAGSFYRVRGKKLLNGKVYCVQEEDIPVARAHADKAVYDAWETRFGPTAKIIPLFERHHYRTMRHFLKSKTVSWPGFRTFLAVWGKPNFRRFALHNILYELPLIGKWYFLKNAARTIIPSLKYGDLEFAKGHGGIRPQLINLKTRTLEMGTAKFFGKREIFNITPSPGASNSLQNGIEDARKTVEFLGEGYYFNEEDFEKEFGAKEEGQK